MNRKTDKPTSPEKEISFLVGVQEVWISLRSIRAKTKKEALEIASKSVDIWTDEEISLEYSHTLDKTTWTVEKKPNYDECSYKGYHNPINDNNKLYGSFEIFYDKVKPGWFWAPGSPGCLWTSEPNGPFVTSMEAYENALKQEGE